MSDKDLDTLQVGIEAQEVISIDPGWGSAGTDYIISGSAGTDTITLDPSWTTMATSITMPSTYTIGAAGSNYYTTGINGNWNNTSSSTVNITGGGIDMAAGTDIKIDGKSLKNFMDKMEERMAILVPDPAKI